MAVIQDLVLTFCPTMRSVQQRKLKLLMLVYYKMKVIGGLLWKDNAFSGNNQTLSGKFCVVTGVFSDLSCLMEALHLLG